MKNIFHHFESALNESNDAVSFEGESPTLRVQWRISAILKTSNKIVYSNAFWYVEVYTYSESLFNTLKLR